MADSGKMERRKSGDRRKRALRVGVERRVLERRQVCACGSRNLRFILQPLPNRKDLHHEALQCLVCGRIRLLARGESVITWVRGGEIVV